MVQATITKTRLNIEFTGTGGKSGGSYNLACIKPGAADESLYAAAYALNDLQTDLLKKVFKSVETVLSVE